MIAAPPKVLSCVKRTPSPVGSTRARIFMAVPIGPLPSIPTTLGGSHSATVHSTSAGMPITLIFSVTTVPCRTSATSGGGPAGNPS